MATTIDICKFGYDHCGIREIIDDNGFSVLEFWAAEEAVTSSIKTWELIGTQKKEYRKLIAWAQQKLQDIEVADAKRILSEAQKRQETK